MDHLESALETSLNRHLTGVPAYLSESIRYSLLAPGKRIRPRLTLASAEMLGTPMKAALGAALAIEMIHCFTLIHDDLPCMDDDDFRRGRPSNHKQFGEATALLAGDGLIGVALDCLLDAGSEVSPAALIGTLRTFSTAIGPRGVIGGQAAETELGQKPSPTLADLRSMHARKTGALFEASLLMPRDLLGLTPAQLAEPKYRSLDEFAAQLGLAFQVMDDLDDATTDEDGGRTPLNVLHYQSEKEARAETSRKLQAAMNGLETHWGGASGQLNRIASEVLRQIEPRP